MMENISIFVVRSVSEPEPSGHSEIFNIRQFGVVQYETNFVLGQNHIYIDSPHITLFEYFMKSCVK